jgi:hypothetical protein
MIDQISKAPGDDLADRDAGRHTLTMQGVA